MDKKYELTDETKEFYGHTLHRIKALRDFGGVRKGDLGGWVESEYNLSQLASCWVFDDACVVDDGRVSDNGWVYDNGRVFGDGCVSGTAHVTDHDRITGSGSVTSNDDFATVSGFGTENRSTTFFRCEDGKVRTQCGCFYGTIDEFREQVKKTREGKVAEEYLMIANLMEHHFRVEDKNE